MGAKKPRIVIIGAGMAGLTAANKLYVGGGSRDLFELVVVEGGPRIGGRIKTSEFGGDRVEMGATWIHGIGGSPIHGIAKEIRALESEQPWECMDGFLDGPQTVAEGRRVVSPSIVDNVSTLFRVLMDFAGKPREDCPNPDEKEYYDTAAKALEVCATSNGGLSKVSIGSFLRKGLEMYWENHPKDEEIRALEEAVFAMHENTQRTYTSAGDLYRLDFEAESEYRMFPGEEITIASGYSRVIEHLASVLPEGMIQLGRKVSRIEWNQDALRSSGIPGKGHCDSDNRPVMVHFWDGSVTSADHVIVTISLGVLKAGISGGSGLFSPPLPDFKREAISRLGFGVVNKLFLQLGPGHHSENFPFLQMGFHPSDSELRHRKVPWWMRRTATLCPIYKNSKVVLSWFAGEEALELEKLTDQEIIGGVSSTILCLLPESDPKSSKEICNGSTGNSVKFTKVLKSKWASDPLFLGSYSYVQVGSSGDDLDALAEPLPRLSRSECEFGLQILFAGEATHRTHYSTTHGAYFSGLREANRLLKHYQCG
ncbi:probable polyamine oxidase 5 [Punica granatum]|uniref:Amine oxidase domain-containing protein n=2 Tax=Punica granatum TaxID=22663 RepID=A0A218XDY1_PUNGR|nr:probable polyamine oxidase 5 [Punica granatum]OWM83157.1 hypothetical protein CDL15_Pgr011839 [Punica granatum]PKI61866.1 hypothetical protein CRG98_017764 [Punica granatum]